MESRAIIRSVDIDKIPLDEISRYGSLFDSDPTSIEMAVDETPRSGVHIHSLLANKTQTTVLFGVTKTNTRLKSINLNGSTTGASVGLELEYTDKTYSDTLKKGEISIPFTGKYLAVAIRNPSNLNQVRKCVSVFLTVVSISSLPKTFLFI